MSDITFDQGGSFPSPLTEWYRERPFKLALAGSLLVHAALIAALPGFRSVPLDVPKVLDVQIVPEEPPVVQVPVRKQPSPVVKQEVEPPPLEAPKPVIEPPKPVEQVKPVVEPPKPVEPVKSVVEPPKPVVEPPKSVVEQVKPEPRKVEPRPEPTVKAPEPARPPEPVVRQVEPATPPPPRTEVLQTAPRPEQKPEQFSMPKPDPRPLPSTVEPRVEARPDAPIPRQAPTQQVPVVPPRTEPVTPQAVTPPPTVAPPPPTQAAVQAPPPPAAPVQRAEPVADRALVNTYEKNLSDLIKRHEKYPDRARRQGWQGTTVVGLSLSSDGKVVNISILESSGREILDDAALEMVKRASPLPRAPEGLRGQERVVRVPIVFKLNS